MLTLSISILTHKTRLLHSLIQIHLPPFYEMGSVGVDKNLKDNKEPVHVAVWRLPMEYHEGEGDIKGGDVECDNK